MFKIKMEVSRPLSKEEEGFIGYQHRIMSSDIKFVDEVVKLNNLQKVTNNLIWVR